MDKILKRLTFSICKSLRGKVHSLEITEVVDEYKLSVSWGNLTMGIKGLKNIPDLM